MGKITGFLEHQRIELKQRAVTNRLGDYREFVERLSCDQAQTQGARCMDCGIPFCNDGCPVHNLIPDWNDLVYQGDMTDALRRLHATNNFPEFTGRICPAPCEAACTLNLERSPVGIKSIENYIIEMAWQEGWVHAEKPDKFSGYKVAVVGSGPAGLAAAQQLCRAGHAVTVFEKNEKIGGLLRFGIPDFKLDKQIIDRRLQQMSEEGVEFVTSTLVGPDSGYDQIMNTAQTHITPAALRQEYDAVVLTVGSEVPRVLAVDGAEGRGVYPAMQFLARQNRINGQATVVDPISAKGLDVVVIGGGDTGSDCVGTSLRQGARSVTQLELLPKPPEQEDLGVSWPYWPNKLRTSSSHEEGCERLWAVTTLKFERDAQGAVQALTIADVDWQDHKMKIVEASARPLNAQLVLLAMGFVHPNTSVLQAFDVTRDARNNVASPEVGADAFTTNHDGVFAAGDCRRGQSLVVWAIDEGRRCATAVDRWLTKVKS